MMRRLYIDNYQCFTNFDYSPTQVQLVYGLNGSGKSTVFELLTLIRDFIVDGTRVEDSFPAHTLTRWQSRMDQTFELEVELPEGSYRYRLRIEQDPDGNRCRIASEELRHGGRPLFAFNNGEAQLHRDNYTKGPVVHLDWGRSGVAAIAERHDNQLLTAFKRWVGRILTCRLNPFAIGPRSEREESRLNPDATNFASWYRHASQENPGALHPLFRCLAEVMEGFDSLRLVQEGGAVRMLRATLRANADENGSEKLSTYGFEELSDGQRAIIVLNTLLYFVVERDTIVCLDEPDNFLALAEIQPWLMSLVDRAEETGARFSLPRTIRS